MEFSLSNIAKKLTSNASDNISEIVKECLVNFDGNLCVYTKSDVNDKISVIKASDSSNIVYDILDDGKGYIFNEEIITGKKPNFISNDIPNTKYGKSDSYVKSLDAVSCIVVPVFSGDNISGTLSVYFKENRNFTNHEIDILSDYAGLLCLEESHLSTYNNLTISKTKYNTVFDNSTDSILLLLDDSIIEVNSTGCELFGYSMDELTGNSLFSLIAQTDQNNIQLVNIKDFINNSKAGEYHHIEDVLVKKDAKEFDGEIILTNIESNCNYNLLAIIRDISRRKEYEKGLIEASERANELNKLKSMSLANMSHEIRTPLNSIIGFSGLLLDDETTEDEKEMFSKLIRTAGMSLMQLIGDIIDISKIEAGQVTIKKTMFNVNSFLQDILLTFKQEKENQDRSDIELKLVLSDKASELKIETDSHRLQQIFNNLLTNSLKFIDEGFIEFGYLSITPEYIQFYVKDTGVGIDTTKREKIFEQFGQDKITYSRNKEGTGLGLAISKTFVELLGGKIWLDSELDAGSTFYFTIPFDAESYKVKTLVPIFGDENIDWSNRTIVIADDVEENYVFLKGVLLSTKVKLLWAKDGQEAVDFCDNENVDIVLMDIRMPVMDGLEATRLIKKSDPNVHVIAQTAFANPEDKVNCEKSGCDQYFKKPINHEKLFKVISKYFG